MFARSVDGYLLSLAEFIIRGAQEDLEKSIMVKQYTFCNKYNISSQQIELKVTKKTVEFCQLIWTQKWLQEKNFAFQVFIGKNDFSFFFSL